MVFHLKITMQFQSYSLQRRASLDVKPGFAATQDFALTPIPFYITIRSLENTYLYR
jgi:hypothetical protein